MAKIELLLPKMGESVAEATVTTWLKNEGDHVDLEECVLEIATDKVDSEIPSTHEGILVRKLCKEGDVIQVGAPFAIIETSSDTSSTAISNEKTDDIYSSEAQGENTITKEVKVTSKVEIPKNSDSDRFYSPLVRSIALKEDISIETLSSIPGTGRNGRVTKSDIVSFIESGTLVSPSSVTSNIPSQSVKPAISVSGADEIIEMDRMRKLIANHMVKSKQIAPHVTSMVEIDVTNMVLWRNKIKQQFQDKEGFKITFTPLFIEAVAKAIKEFPLINVSVNNDKIIIKKDINIGMAVALPSGNLIVPVVKNADQLNLIGVSKYATDLAYKARDNKLNPDDVQGGTFTITNVGTFGNVMGTPIINQPEVAILSVGIIKKKPAVIETLQGDTIGIRHMMYLSMSYDHRVVDGMLGGSFLRKVGDYLENFDINRQIW
jgi:2-oxoglutarate dehydrogenase E2 component (dihydrolipoamide succinyltransferase)